MKTLTLHLSPLTSHRALCIVHRAPFTSHLSPLTLPCALCILLTACHRTPQFEISGHLTDAAGQTLYLEHTGLVQTTLLDSCSLNQQGAFHFCQPAPEFPDFYRLRVDNKHLVIAIDSTEKVQVEASLTTLPYTQQIQGSEASKTIASLRQTAAAGSLDSLRAAAQDIIVANPRSTAAYYALFIRYQNGLIWDVWNTQDRRWFQAVATAYHVWMPEYERSKALYGQIEEILQHERQLRSNAAVQQMIAASESVFLDISLPNEKEKVCNLSDYKGKVILLDFSMTQMERAQGYIFGLRDLYNQFSSKGLVIYSVSVDPNFLAWQDAVSELPWTTVYAIGGANDPAIHQYNVLDIPTMFVLDRKGNVQGRFNDFESAKAAILRYL